MKGWVLAAILVLAAASAACGGEGDTPAGRTSTPSPAATPRPVPTAIPSPSPTPALIGGVEAVPLTVGEVTELPADVAIIVETGCYNCGGPPSSYLRVYRDSSGRFRRDTLLAVDSLALGPWAVQSDGEAVREEHLYMTGRAFSTDAWRVVVGVCTRGSCIELGESPSADAETSLFRSGDGGVTWEELTELEGAAFPLAMRLEGVVIGRFDTWPQLAYEIYPTGESVDVPADVSSWAMPLPDGELLWPTDDGRVLRSDGSVFLDIGGDPAHEYHVTRLTTDPAAETLLFALMETTFAPQFAQRDFLFSTDGNGNVQKAFSVDFLPWLGAWLGPDLFLGNADIPADQAVAAGLPALAGPVPVLLDIGAGVARPVVEPFADPDFPTGRNFLVGVQRGPFARVISTGSCLNVREAAGLGAEILDCAADGVLLRDLPNTVSEGGLSWVHIIAPSGWVGWAAADYLEP